MVLVIGSKEFCEDIRNMLGILDIPMIFESDLNKAYRIIKRSNVSLVIFDDDAYSGKNKKPFFYISRTIKKTGKRFIIVSSKKDKLAILRTSELGAIDYIIKPYNYREFIARFNAVYLKNVRISCIGGGTGLFYILAGLRKLPNVHLTSIVNMSDDGGSSGRLKTTFGVLPPGDVRRSLVALSNAPQIMNELIQYRFSKGKGINGHNLGNLLLTALSNIKGSLAEAVRSLSDILNVRGAVLPIINTKTTLCAKFENDKLIRGESNIDLCKGRKPQLHIEKIWHEPKPQCNVEALAAIIHSEIIIIGPGDLFTSIITNLLVKDIREAICRTKAKKIYICNLMTKPGETYGYSVCDHVREIIKYLKKSCLDYVIVSNTALSQTALRKYAKNNQFPVILNENQKISRLTRAKIIYADVSHEKDLVHHDSYKMMYAILKIIKTDK